MFHYLSIFTRNNSYDLCSTRSNCFGKFQLKGSSQSPKKRAIISPSLAREDPEIKNVLIFNKQAILMPPVKKPLISKPNNMKINFMKVSRNSN